MSTWPSLTMPVEGRRGRYEVQTYPSGQIAASGRVRSLPPVSVLVRVVDYDADLQGHLDAATPDNQQGPQEVDADDLVQLMAPYLRGGLLDPGSGRRVRCLPPVQLVLKGGSLTFVQAVAGLN